MKIINHQFLDALHKLKQELGTNKSIAESADISEVHVGRLLSGKIEMLKDDTYGRLHHLLEPYLDKDYEYSHYAHPAKASDRKKCPCPAGLSDMEKLLVKYFRGFNEEEKLSILVMLKDKRKLPA
ncbi:MAG: hypothetical protein WC637_16845 [Victivallales bacterium]|jgi:hypothetical protein